MHEQTDKLTLCSRAFMSDVLGEYAQYITQVHTGFGDTPRC